MDEHDVPGQPLKLFGFKDLKELVGILRKPEYNVDFVRFITADMFGEQECSFTVPSQTITDNPESLRKGFDASSLYPERINESDKLAIFDPATARVFPVVYKTKTPGFEKTWKEVMIFGDVIDPKNGEYVYDSRTKLKKVLESAKSIAGADHVYLGPELEFFLFEADEKGKPALKDSKPVLVDEGTYFKGGLYGEVRKEAQKLMSEMGYEFEYDHHEVARSQHEIDVHYMDALDIADFVMIYRYTVKRVAKAYGLFASFMPKPLLNQNGSGMHVHQSLFSRNNNLFFDAKDKYGLSETAYQYMAGLMKYVPEITAFLNQWTNSYKRLVPGFEAPVYICWDLQNRSNLIRKPEYEPGNEKATRLELRSPDPATNPYLAFALMISAGIKGIEEKLPRPVPSELNVYELNQEERDAHGIKSLPGSLEEAVNLAEKSELVKSVVGERFLADFVRIKRKIIEHYNMSFDEDEQKRMKKDWVLPSYELKKLLPIL